MQKVCLVTGATSGIGLVTAIYLAQKNCRVIITGRSSHKCQKIVSEIKKETANQEIEYLLADFSKLDDIRNLAKNFSKKHRKLDILVNNVGVYHKNNSLLANAYKTTITVNYLAPFLLTNLLIDALKKPAASRIINISSFTHRQTKLNLDNFLGNDKDDPKKAYRISKLAVIMFTYEIVKKLKGTNVTANVMCPGGVATNIWQTNRDLATTTFKLFLPLLKTPEQAAKLVVYLAESPELKNVTGKYFEIPTHFKFMPYNIKKTMVSSSPESYDQTLIKKLWQLSEELTGLK